MTHSDIRLLDDLRGEFARVAAEHAPGRRRSAPGCSPWPRPSSSFSERAPTPCRQHAPRSTTSRPPFAGWFEGGEETAPGRALRPEDDGPDWVREQGGQLIAEKAGVGLYVTRSETHRGTTLNFALDRAISVGNTLDGWRETFADKGAIVFGPTAFGPPGASSSGSTWPPST